MSGRVLAGATNQLDSVLSAVLNDARRQRRTARPPCRRPSPRAASSPAVHRTPCPGAGGPLREREAHDGARHHQPPRRRPPPAGPAWSAGGPASRPACSRTPAPASRPLRSARVDSPWKPIGPTRSRAMTPSPATIAPRARLRVSRTDRHEGDARWRPPRTPWRRRRPRQHGRGAGRQEPGPAPGGGAEHRHRTASARLQNGVGGVVARSGATWLSTAARQRHSGHGRDRTPPCASGGWRTGGAGWRSRRHGDRPIYAMAP